MNTRVHRVPTRPVMLVLVAAIAAGCGDDGPTAPGPGASDFEWSGQVAQGDAIEIKGISGGITASLASGSEVEVFATKTGQQSSPSTVEIEVVEHAGGVTICAVYPDVAGQPPNDCAPGLGGYLSNQGNDVEVAFSVRVPAGVNFVGRTVAGNVSGSGLQGDAFAYVVSGDVSLDATGVAEATTVTGLVDITFDNEQPTRNLSFTAVTGNVTVRVSSNLNAEILASIVSGTVSSDFPLTETSPGVWEATLGNGGPTLVLSAVTGNLALLSGS